MSTEERWKTGGREEKIYDNLYHMEETGNGYFERFVINESFYQNRFYTIYAFIDGSFVIKEVNTKTT